MIWHDNFSDTLNFMKSHFLNFRRRQGFRNKVMLIFRKGHDVNFFTAQLVNYSSSSPHLPQLESSSIAR